MSLAHYHLLGVVVVMWMRFLFNSLQAHIFLSAPTFQTSVKSLHLPSKITLPCPALLSRRKSLDRSVKMHAMPTALPEVGSLEAEPERGIFA